MFERKFTLELPEVTLFFQPSASAQTLHFSPKCKNIKKLRRTVSTTFKEQASSFIDDLVSFCLECCVFSNRMLQSVQRALEVDKKFSTEPFLFRSASPMQQLLDLNSIKYSQLDYKWYAPFNEDADIPDLWKDFCSQADLLVKHWNDSITDLYTSKLCSFSSASFKEELLVYLADTYVIEAENAAIKEAPLIYKKADLLSPAVFFCKPGTSWTLQDTVNTRVLLLLTDNFEDDILRYKPSGYFIYAPLAALLWISKALTASLGFQIALSPKLESHAEEMVSSLFTWDK